MMFDTAMSNKKFNLILILIILYSCKKQWVKLGWKKSSFICCIPSGCQQSCIFIISSTMMVFGKYSWLLILYTPFCIFLVQFEECCENWFIHSQCYIRKYIAPPFCKCYRNPLSIYGRRYTDYLAKQSKYWFGVCWCAVKSLHRWGWILSQK